MLSLTPIRNSPVDGETKTYPSRRLRGLWRLNDPTEPMVTVQHGISSGARKLWYQSPDEYLGCVYYFAPDYFSNKTPVVVLLGPLLHPDVALKKTLPWIRAALADGQPVYAVAHRSHRKPTAQMSREMSCSFADIVEFDILSALDVINHHAGTQNIHIIGQDLGSILTLYLMSLIEQRRVKSLHLFNVPYTFPTSLTSTVLSFVHQDHTIRQVWSRHLHTQSLPVWANELSLTERSALLYSDSWLSKGWIKELRNNRTIETLHTHQNITLKQSFPKRLLCPVHIYSSWAEDRDVHASSWFENPHIVKLSKSVFPLLRENTYLTTDI